MKKARKSVAIIGGGPAGLFMFKRLVESGNENIEVTIFEKSTRLGAGMPYSDQGACLEHVTNVSGNEIPEIVVPVSEWMDNLPNKMLDKYAISSSSYNDYKVLPRLLFGEYLEAQFNLLLERAVASGISTRVHLNTLVSDLKYLEKSKELEVHTNDVTYKFDYAVICTGHSWSTKNEAVFKGYFDSPYPPSKISIKLNHTVAVRGSSLTAVDAMRTLARNNGKFEDGAEGFLKYVVDEGSEDFKIVIHTRNGFLPAVRFHLEDSHLKNDSLLTEEEIQAHRAQNGGFLSLDYLFEHDFKKQIRLKDPDFYEKIQHLNIEAFVAEMMQLREKLDPFTLLRAEYAEAEKSIKRHESVYWKEMLAVLSFAMNYPAKYLSAEDMLRLKGTLMPLISIVIAFLPQTSCRELLALHDAGCLSIVAVGDDSKVIPETEGGITYEYTDEEGNLLRDRFQTFIDCIGQPHLLYNDFPFKSLIEEKVVSPALLKFEDISNGTAYGNENPDGVEISDGGEIFLKVPGIAINDDFQVVDRFGAYNESIYIMAVPYIGGYNPDYSGLDFAEAASDKIITSILAN